MKKRVDKTWRIWYYKDNEEGLLERDTPVRSCDTASLSEDFWMTVYPCFIAKGYSNNGGITPVTLWNVGNYMYEIEARENSYYAESEVFEASYEEAMEKFEKMVDKTCSVW